MEVIMPTKPGTKFNAYFTNMSEVCKDEYWNSRVFPSAPDEVSLYVEDGSDFGLSGKDGTLIRYSNTTGNPIMILERVTYPSKNLIKRAVYRMQLLNKVKTMPYEFGFKLSVTFYHDYVDIIHYKEDWLECFKREHPELLV